MLACGTVDFTLSHGIWKGMEHGVDTNDPIIVSSQARQDQQRIYYCMLILLAASEQLSHT